MYPSGFAPGPLARDLLHWPAAFVLPVIGGTALGIAIACLFGQPYWGDQSMYLVAAGKALDGARFGKDIIDVNPPLILWLSEIPVALARLLHVMPQSAMQALLGLATAALLAWSLMILRPVILRGADESLWASEFAWWLAALMIYATTIHPWYHVGTREHILVLFLLPYLMLAARRLEGKADASLGQTLGAGLFAVAGCGLKPQHLLVVLAVEGLVLIQARSWRPLLRPEIIALVAGGIAYCAAIIVLSPEYLGEITPFAVEAYLDRARKPWLDLLAADRSLKIVLAVFGWAVLRPYTSYRSLADVFMAAGMAGLAAYLLQRKGYEYQLVPALAFLHLALGICAVGYVSQRYGHWFNLASARSPRAAVIAALVTALVAGLVYYPGHAQQALTKWPDARGSTRKAITAQIPAGSTVFMLSSSVGGIHDDLLRRRLEWGSRFTVLWMTQALLTRDLRSPKELALARWTLDAMVEDLARYKPSLIIVDRCDDEAYKPCMEMGGKYVPVLSWFLEDPGFSKAWERYTLRRTVGPFDLWCATDDSRACDSVLASLKTE